jgi:hypothetical protein
MRRLSIVLMVSPPFESHRDSVALGLGQAMSSVLLSTESVGSWVAAVATVREHRGFTRWTRIGGGR